VDAVGQFAVKVPLAELADLERARRVESIREGVREADATDESRPETEIVVWEGNPLS
jgi:hypothetical protein